MQLKTLEKVVDLVDIAQPHCFNLATAAVQPFPGVFAITFLLACFTR